LSPGELNAYVRAELARGRARWPAGAARWNWGRAEPPATPTSISPKLRQAQGEPFECRPWRGWWAAKRSIRWDARHPLGRVGKAQVNIERLRDLRAGAQRRGLHWLIRKIVWLLLPRGAD